MLSCPPATTIVSSPSTMCCAPSATARSPEPQTWLMLQAALSFGRPALICACRAGFCPCAAVSTWPRMVSDTSPGSTPARSSTALITAAPSSCAGVLANEPLKLPTGVRAGRSDYDIGHGSPSLGGKTALLAREHRQSPPGASARISSHEYYARSTRPARWGRGNPRAGRHGRTAHARDLPCREPHGLDSPRPFPPPYRRDRADRDDPPWSPAIRPSRNSLRFTASGDGRPVHLPLTPPWKALTSKQIRIALFLFCAHGALANKA